MSSNRKIVLHTGLPKTGTSTIQNVFYKNRDFLLQQEGVLYPSLLPNLSTPLHTIFSANPQNQNVNKVSGFTTEELAARRQNYLDRLDAEISLREWNTLLLSAEGLSNLSVPDMAKLREWGEKYALEWIVLVCVRHPVDYVRSVIQQSLKNGETLQDLYENLPTPRYSIRIANAMSMFGQENVKVFDFDTAAKNDGGIVGTFARQVGLTTPSCEFLASQAVRTNESLSLEATQILDSLNRQRPMFVGGVRAPRRAGPWHELDSLRRIKGRKFDIPDSVKVNIRLQSREDTVWLNEEFGLDLYRDVTDVQTREENHEQPVEALSDPAIDTIAEVLGELVTAKAFRHAFDRGKVALRRGDLERAEKMLRTAVRLDPDAWESKKLLRKATAKRSGGPIQRRPKDKIDTGLAGHKKVAIAIRSWLKKRA